MCGGKKVVFVVVVLCVVVFCVCVFFFFFFFFFLGGGGLYYFVARRTLRAFKIAFKFGTANFTNSLSPISIVKRVCTGNKNIQGA